MQRRGPDLNIVALIRNVQVSEPTAFPHRFEGVAHPMSTPPRWFTDALATPATEHSTTAGGARIAYRQWGSNHQSGVVLVHGGAAHSRWWDHIGPMLARDECVVALDLSGHGDSERRPIYDKSTWAEEIISVIEHVGFVEPPIVVGHSMGGWITAIAAAEHGDRLAGIVLIDSPIRDLPPEEMAARNRTAFGPLLTYPDRASALEKFRTIPDQPDSLGYVMDHVAASSLRRVSDGWTWKFDPIIFNQKSPPEKLLRDVTIRVAVLRGEFGLVTPDIGTLMYELLGRVAPIIEIPLAGHHMMLDQPLPLIASLRTIRADWDHSSPIHRAEVPHRDGAVLP
jgi:pimeloyl-ACP methyl ester carboxylesterase